MGRDGEKKGEGRGKKGEVEGGKEREGKGRKGKGRAGKGRGGEGRRKRIVPWHLVSPLREHLCIPPDLERESSSFSGRDSTGRRQHQSQKTVPKILSR